MAGTLQDLYHQAEAQLRHWQVLDPVRRPFFQRLISPHLCADPPRTLRAGGYAAPPGDAQQALDAILAGPAWGVAVYPRGLAADPPEATPTAIKAYLDRYHRVRDWESTRASSEPV